MNRLIVILFLVISITDCFVVKGFSKENLNLHGNENNSVDHSAWDKLLKKYVADNGDVNYKDFITEAELLNAYIDYLATKIPSEDWSKQEKLAYFINVYNANTIKLILDHYPIKSIKVLKNPWSRKIIQMGEKIVSLSEIENKILRKMNEPRIHFAINCASKSCPKLLNEAFTSENVESLLDKATKEFISNAYKNTIKEQSVQLSKIFQWYKSDFTTHGNLVDYIKQYNVENIPQDAKISYLEYDWNLNEQH